MRSGPTRAWAPDRSGGRRLAVDHRISPVKNLVLTRDHETLESVAVCGRQTHSDVIEAYPYRIALDRMRRVAGTNIFDRPFVSEAKSDARRPRAVA